MDANISTKQLLSSTACLHPLVQCTKEEYQRIGSDALGEQLKRQLTAEGSKPYVIPVGGSNALGCWGYLQAVEELAQQARDMDMRFDDIVMVRLLLSFAACRLVEVC